MGGIVFDYSDSCRRKCTFGSIPEGKDRVLISDTFNLKPSGVSTLYLLGVKEGSFPATAGCPEFLPERKGAFCAV